MILEKWDVHTHSTPSPDTYQRLSKFIHYKDFIRVRAHPSLSRCAQLVSHDDQVQRQIEANAYDSAVRLKDCQKHQVHMQVLSPTPMMIPDYVDRAQDALEICRIINDANAQMVADHPERFTALAALPMMFPEVAIAEMQRIHRLGMRGLEINSNINGRDLDDPLFFPIFEAAQDLDLGIFIHPWSGFMSPVEERLQKRMNTNRNWRPWLLAMGMETGLAFDAMRSGGVHERLPKLRVLYAHGGGVFPSLLGRLEHGSHCRADLFAYKSQKNPYQVVDECGVYADTLTHDPWVLEFLIKTLGVHRLAMGSDYPYPLGEMDALGDRGLYPGFMIEHLPKHSDEMTACTQHFPWIHRKEHPLPCLSLEQKQRLLSGTAKEWLAMS